MKTFKRYFLIDNALHYWDKIPTNILFFQISYQLFRSPIWSKLMKQNLSGFLSFLALYFTRTLHTFRQISGQ